MRTIGAALFGDVYYTIAELSEARSRISDLLTVDNSTGNDPAFASAVASIRTRNDAAEAAIGSQSALGTALSPSGPYTSNQQWGDLINLGREAATLAARIAQAHAVEVPQSAADYQTEQGGSMSAAVKTILTLATVGVGAYIAVQVVDQIRKAKGRR